MSGRADGEVALWPLWARALVIGVLVALGLVGLVSFAAGGDLDPSVIRVAIVASVVPALLIPLQRLGIRRRRQRLRERADAALARATEALDAVRRSDPATYDDGAALLARVRSALAAEDDAAALSSLQHVERLAGSWPAEVRDPLGAAHAPVATLGRLARARA